MTNNNSFVQLAKGKRPPRQDGSLWARLLALPSYYLLLITCYWVLFIHIGEINIGLSMAGFISITMQFPAIKARFSKKGYAIAQKMIVLAVLAILFGQFESMGATSFSINFLVMCFFAKLWEVYHKRDAYIVLNLGLFVIAAGFLWSQSLGMTIKAVFAVLAVLMSFVALADDSNTTGAGRVRALGWVTLPAIPLLVLLFLFFPRFNPLWQLNLGVKQATTGISDSMSPGDFANLSKSADLAFRVEFDGQIPNRHELYWRGLIFTEFDGVTWRQDSNRHQYQFWRPPNDLPSWASVLQGKAANSYTVLLEPTHQHWLFGLDYSRPLTRRGMAMMENFTLRSLSPVSSRFTYKAAYYPHAKVGQNLTEAERQSALKLPSAGNQQARALAQAFAQKAQGNTQTLVNLIQQYISQGDYYYTLSPPALRAERIDEFLFESKRGFCEHYASSFVFLMRSAGVPARVVTGYQGGKLGRDGKSWEVRQMDAHAWAEVWIEEQGWVRVDPTAFVAPSRILDGMSDYTEEVGAMAFGDGVAGVISYQQFRLLQSMKRFSDEMGYYWHKNVVGFDSEAQKKSLGRLGIASLTKQILVMAGGFLVILAVVVGVFWYRRRVIYHVFDKPIYKLSKHLAKQDKVFAKQPTESYLGYLHRLADNANDDTKQEILALAKTYRTYRYGRMSEQAQSTEYRQYAKIFAKHTSKLIWHIQNNPK